jgi:hypothetical protein
MSGAFLFCEGLDEKVKTMDAPVEVYRGYCTKFSKPKNVIRRCFLWEEL